MKVRHIPSDRKKISFKRHYMDDIFPKTLLLGEEVKEKLEGYLREIK